MILFHAQQCLLSRFQTWPTVFTHSLPHTHAGRKQRRSCDFLDNTQTPMSALITTNSLDILVTVFQVCPHSVLSRWIQWGPPAVFSHPLLLDFYGLYKSQQRLRSLSLGHLRSLMHLLGRKYRRTAEFSECLKAALMYSTTVGTSGTHKWMNR